MEKRKKWDRAYYAKNKHKDVARNKRTRQRNREWKRQFYGSKGCQWVGCDITDPDMLDFNYTVDKVYDLSFMVARGYSITRLETEARKGFVLCANHHCKWTVLSRSEAKDLKKYLKPTVII